MISLRPITLQSWIALQDPTIENATTYDTCLMMETDKPILIQLSINNVWLPHKAFWQGWYADGNNDLWIGFMLRRNKGTLFKRPVSQVRFVRQERERKPLTTT